MDPGNDSSKIGPTRFLVVAASLVIIIVGLSLAQSVVVLFLISIFIALLGAPPLLWLKEKKVPSLLAVLIVVSAMVVVILLITAQIGTSINGFVTELPQLQKDLGNRLVDINKYLATKGIIVDDGYVMDYFNPDKIMGLTADLLTSMSTVLSDLILILLTVTFILLEVSSFPIKLRAILGDPKQAFPQFTKFVVDMKRFMVLKTMINLAAGILVGVWMYILDVRFPVLWGFLAFLLHYIPNVGAFLSAIPAALLALIQLGPWAATLVILGNVVIGFIIGNMIEPRLMGKNLNLSTLVVFLSLIFWGSLLGLAGAILCIPLTITMKFAFESNEKTRWIAILLGSEDAKEFRIPVEIFKRPRKKATPHDQP